MTAEIVNLRRARKARNRAGREDAAGRNRPAFGRGKQQRLAEEALARQASRRLDGHRREPDPQGPESDAPDG